MIAERRMDSRLHTQRSRNRARLSRAFSPAQYAQQQHLPPPPPAPPPPAPYQVQHRLPLVGEQFAGMPMDHDYATMLAYRQRVNGLLSSQPHPHPHLPAGMVSHVTRNQNAAWSQAQERIHSTDNRLDDYNRQGAGFGREYRVRDDLQSLSELDSSRRSAALSAKLFLDDVRTGAPVFRRETPFESTLPIELNRHHHIERQDISNDLLLAKASQQIPRKRNREADVDMDRDRVTRHRRFYDPGLAVLPRTPEVSRDFPIVQRMLSSGRFVESENPQDSHIIPNRSTCSNERFLTSPSKSIKRRPSMPHRKILPSDSRYLSPGNAPCSVTRLDAAKEKAIGVKDSPDIHSRIRELHLFEEGARDNRLSSSSPSASHFEKNIGAGFTGDKRSNSFENARASKVHSAGRAKTLETLEKGQEAGSQSSKQRLATRSLTSIRKALRAVDATPRNKNLKSRVIRLLGSDAKVCGTSPKSRQGGRGDKRELVPELHTAKRHASSSFKQAVEHDKELFEQKESKALLGGMKIKQEQSAPTDLESNRASQHAQSPERSISLPQIQCDLSADCRIKALKENNASTPVNLLQLGLEKQQTHVSSKSGLPHSRQDEAVSPQWHAATENSGLSIVGSVGSQSSTRQMSQRNGLAEKEQSMASSLLSLNVNSDADDLGRKTVKGQVSATPNSSVSLNSQLLKPVMPTLPDACPASTRSYNSHGIQRTQSPSSSLFQVFNPDAPVSVMVKFAGEACAENRAALLEVQKIFSNAKVSVIDTNETTAEREVRLFGKSLKAPVAKVNLDSAGSSTSLGLSLDRVEKLGLSTSQLASEQQGTPAGLCTKSIIADVDVLSVSMPIVASKWGEATSGSEKGVEKTIAVPPHGMTTHPASPTLDVVAEKLATSHSSPNKFYEAEVCTLYESVSEPVCLSPVLASEQQMGLSEPVQEIIEATSDAALNIGAQSAFTVPDLASDQEGDASGSQTTDACMHMHVQEQQKEVLGPQATDACADILKPTSMLDLVPEQQACCDARQDVPPKDSAPEEDSCQSEAGFKHGGKLEAVSSDKPVNCALSKQVTVATLHPHKRLQNMSGRAVANTWRRSSGNNGFSSSLAVPKVPKPLVNKHPLKFVNQKVSEAAAYVRKGNSLVRAPISTVTGVSPLSNTGAPGIGKDLLKKEVTAPCVNQGFKNAGKNTRSAFRQTFSAQKMVANEAPSRAPIHDKLSASNLECPQNGNVGPSQVGVKSVFSEGQPHSSAKTMGAEEVISRMTGLEGSDSEPNATVQPRPVPPCVQPGSSVSKMSEIISTFYVKSKANQLVAALPAKTPQVTSSHLSPNDLYYKRNNNQLLRNGSLQKKQAVQVQKSREESHAIWHSTVRKAFRKRAYLPSSRVWTLKDGPSSQVKSVLPLLFPWKRPSRGVSFCAGRFKALPKAKKGSLLFLISKKLQRLRKVQPVYSRSAGGFSLHRSGLLSLSGANLKWTKSIEKRSKLASEEATKAVAEVEKQRRKEKEAVAVATNAVTETKVHRQVAHEAARERVRVVTIGLARYQMDPLGRTLQRLPDQWSGNTDASHLKRSTDSAILSTPRRLSFDGTEYVRVGNGHQLVRDPKAASRALANEKVRWSLHTVRSRHAKRQQYCLFYTRFGKCNKGEGDCPYIHDAEKIAVCTKFLKGTCSGINCLFSHKVIPDRMPDCSFYLEGMCTNEDCPYRHVSVNPKAPICEGFLKGFCSEGDECNKKHTTVCPTFAATGECPDKSVCKLHHPKKNGKRVSHGNVCKPKAKRRRRYFGMETVTSGGGPAGEFCAEEEAFFSFSSADDRSTMEFIEIGHIVDDDVNENDDFQRKLAFIKQHLPLLPTNALQDDADMLIKPLLLLTAMPVPA